MIRTVVALSLVLCAAACNGEELRNWIFQHNSNYWADPNDPNAQDPNYLYVNQIYNRVTIYAGVEGQPFQFEARMQSRPDSQQPWVDAGEGDINLIEADASATGVIVVRIAETGEHEFGADAIRQMKLNAPNATVRVEDVHAHTDLGRWGDTHVQDVYGRNTPEARVFAVSSCRGDAWNSGVLDFDDVDPFVELLYDIEEYCAHYPALRGSAFFKGDVSGDDLINFDDIAFFVERLQSEDPACNCYFAPGWCPGDRLTAAQLADTLKTYVAPQRQAFVADSAGYLAQHHPNQLRRAFWHAVWQRLTE